MAILDVVVAWALYVLLKPVNRSLSLLAAWFRLVYAAILGIALANLFSALLLLSGADHLAVFETDQLYAQVMLFVDTFSYGWDIGIVFLGLHLFVLGYLVFKSCYVPRILGVLLIIGGFGYLIDFAAFIFFPSFQPISGMINTITGMGEIVFGLWLLIKSVNVERWEKRALESA